MAIDLSPSTAIASYGGPDAEAYADYTWVASYIVNNKFEFADWTAATTPQRVSAILHATREIDSKNYFGVKWYWNQKLKFPLVRDSLPQGTIYNTSFYPELAWMERDVKSACAEQALWILRNSGRNYHQEARLQGIVSTSESIGKLSESYSYQGGPAVQLCPEAFALLRKYFGSPRLERA